MATIRITTNIPQVARDLQAAAKAFTKVKTDIAVELGEFGQHAMQAEIKGAGLVGVTGNLLNNITVTTSTKGEAVTTDVTAEQPYADVMDLGRRPGKGVPIDPLMLWVRRKLGVDKSEAKGVAYAISRSIKRKGIKGRDYSAKAFRKVERMAPRVARKHVDAWTRRIGNAG